MKWWKNKGLVEFPILKVKTTRSWESFAIGLIIGMIFSFITFSMGYYADVR